MQVTLRRRTKSRRWKLADEKREEIDAGNAEEKDEEPQVEAIRVRLYRPNCGT